MDNISTENAIEMDYAIIDVQNYAKSPVYIEIQRRQQPA